MSAETVASGADYGAPRPQFTLLRLALRELRGGLAGFYVFVGCIALGVAVIAGVGALADAVQTSFVRQGATLLGGDLRGIARARKLSRATMRNIRQNLAFAFGYNALGVPVAAGLLYPILGLLLDPMIASAAMALSSVSVIANALRLRNANLSAGGSREPDPESL